MKQPAIFVVMCTTSHDVPPCSKKQLVGHKYAAKSVPSQPAACGVSKQLLTCIAINVQRQTHSADKDDSVVKDALDLWLQREAIQGFAASCGEGYCR